MQRFFVGLVLAAAMVAQPFSALAKEEPSTMPKVGDMAPDFTLKYFDGTGLKDVSLDQYRGKKQVVLAFYVFAFTGG
jgi:AhpC/TSA family